MKDIVIDHISIVNDLMHTFKRTIVLHLCLVIYSNWKSFFTQVNHNKITNFICLDTSVFICIFLVFGGWHFQFLFTSGCNLEIFSIMPLAESFKFGTFGSATRSRTWLRTLKYTIWNGNFPIEQFTVVLKANSACGSIDSTAWVSPQISNKLNYLNNEW